MTTAPQAAGLRVSSRDNPLLVKLRKLVQQPAAYRKLGEYWLEGEHLCAAAVARGVQAEVALITEEAWADARWHALASRARRIAIVPAALFAAVSAVESPVGLGFVIAHTPPSALLPAVDTVVLDRLQDAGNVGTILRSAAAFGVRQVLALKGTAALWSPKALRAGMGAHFALHLVEQLSPDDLAGLGLPLVATSSHAEQAVCDARLPSPCAWLLGHEGQGVAPELLARCALTVGIPQPGGGESLNVGVAASVCLYEAMRQRRQAGAASGAARA